MLEPPDNHEENEDTDHGRERGNSLKGWLQKKMADLHQELQTGEWPEGGDRLLRELGRLEATPEDLETLSLAVNDALEGVDITRRYPAFYRRLLADPHLRQIFLDAMDMLERSEEGGLDPLPRPVDVDLSFLRPEANEGARPSSRRESLLVKLTRARDQLRELFVPPSAAVPVRRVLSGMEDAYITLIRSDVSTAQGEFEVILEGRRPAASNALHLSLMLISRKESTDGPDLDATLSWGAYRETRPLDPRGQAAFPPLPLELILDEEGDVLADLELRLTA